MSFYSFIAIGWGQFSLSNGFHEALHNNFGDRQVDIVAEILLAFPIGFSLEYRRIHMQHHKELGNPSLDPDYAYYSRFPTSRVTFLLRIIYMVSGVAAMQQFLTDNSKSLDIRLKKTNSNGTRNILFMQIFILALFSLTVGWVYYFAAWLCPLITFGKLFASLRAMCEHSDPDFDFVTRTITGGWFQTRMLGMFNFNIHGEHHMYPWIPYGSLEEFHKEYAKALNKDEFTNNSSLRYRHFEGGYCKLLLTWFSSLPWLPSNECNSKSSLL